MHLYECLQMSYWRFLCHKFDFNNSQNLNSVNSAHIGEKQKQNKTVQTKKQPTTKKQTDKNQPQKKKSTIPPGHHLHIFLSTLGTASLNYGQ